MASKENKLGIEPVPRLLASMAIPLIIANVITALYNIVDGIYVAELSQSALTATTLCYPMQLFTQSVASGTAGGINSLLSRSLGAKNFDKAEATIQHGLVLSFLSYLLFLIIGVTLSEPFIGLFTKDEELLSLGSTYLSICLVASVGMFFTFLFNGMLESTGHTGFCLIMQGAGALINIVLDPILIFGYFGFPKMGIAGAAVATVFAQIVSAVLGLIFNFSCNHEIKLSLSRFSFDGGIIKEIYTVGVPSMIMMSIGSVMDVGMNKILIKVSGTAVSVFGIYYKLQNFVFMPVFGISQGMVPIVGYNYGARRESRMKEVVKLSLISASILMGMGTLLFQIFPRQLLMWFSATDDMYTLGIPALRIISTTFILAAFCIILGDTLMGMGIGYVSAVNSFLRQIVVLLPLAYFFEKQFGVMYVWYAFVVSEVTSLIFTSIQFKRLWRKKLSRLSEF